MFGNQVKALEVIGYDVAGIETLLEEPIQYDKDVVVAYNILVIRTKKVCSN